MSHRGGGVGVGSSHSYHSNDNDTVYTTEEELKQILSQLNDTEKQLFLEGKTSLSQISRHSQSSSIPSHPNHGRSGRGGDDESIGASTIASLGFKISDEELNARLSKIQELEDSIRNEGGAYNDADGGRKPPSSQAQRPMSKQGLGSNRTSRPSSRGTGDRTKDLINDPLTQSVIKAYRKQSPAHHLGMDPYTENSPTTQGDDEMKPSREDSGEDSIKFINNRLFATTFATNASNDNLPPPSKGISSYSTLPHYLQPTVASVLPPYLHGESERVRNSYQKGNYCTLKQLPSRLQPGNVQLTLKQFQTENLITTYDNVFKPVSKTVKKTRGSAATTSAIALVAAAEEAAANGTSHVPIKKTHDPLQYIGTDYDKIKKLTLSILKYQNYSNHMGNKCNLK